MQQAVTQQPRLSMVKRPSSDFEYPGHEWDAWGSEPGLGVTTTTITTISQTGGDWSTGLFDICSDKNTGLLGAFAPCLLDLSLAHQFGETFCLPLLPGSTLALRVGIRERYKIQGSVCDDWTTVCCCFPLALCQMKREMKKRMKTKTYHVTTAMDCS